MRFVHTLTDRFLSSDKKLKLFSCFRRSSPHLQHRRILFVLHGLGEHGGRYLHYLDHLTSSMDGLYYFDHRGHGESEGVRGHVDRFDLYCEDVVLALGRLNDLLDRQGEKAEIHLLGHSLGGLIALRTLFLYPNLPLVSATLSAPVLGIRMPVPFLKKMAAFVLSRVAGSFSMKGELDASWLSHDPDLVKAYCGDKKVHNQVTPRFFTELLNALSNTVSRTDQFHYPVQFLIPLEDKIVDSRASLSFFETLQASKKRLHTYPHFRHESFNEVGKEQAFEDLRSWIVSCSS